MLRLLVWSPFQRAGRVWAHVVDCPWHPSDRVKSWLIARRPDATMVHILSPKPYNSMREHSQHANRSLKRAELHEDGGTDLEEPQGHRMLSKCKCQSHVK